MTDTHDAREKIAELLTDFRFAMLTTRTPEGKLAAHPLTVQETEFDGDLWFIIGRNSSAVGHMAADANVGVSLSSNDSWVSLSGTATLVEDRAKLEKFWNSAVEAWFPDGPGDPNVTLLKVDALSGEYWDSPGGRVATLASLVKSKVTGKPMEGENEKVEL